METDPDEVDRLSRKARKDYFEEQERARERISPDSGWSFTESFIRWALEFITQPLDKFSKSEWRQLQHEVTAFSTVWPDITTQGTMGQTAAYETWRLTGSWPHSAIYDLPLRTWAEAEAESLRYLPSQKTVTELQEQTRRHLHQVFTPSGTYLEIPEGTKITVVFTSWKLDNEQGVSASRRLVASLPVGFRFNLLEALRKHPDRLRRCSACKKPMFAERKHREYCSDQCRALTNARKKRKTPPERFGKPGRQAGSVTRKAETRTKVKRAIAKKGASHGKKR